ncbi:phosphoribosylformylglycinamidine synthase [Sebaldella sp. S0638]|uniref:phosphoribosylformylglycinamidine synthase n=1 Tax=Sebaldella sp. S0638 TaxID=2957809 RepID=UPI00209F8BCC|nr:phosphoribosylformylglycinamidine synthase [Sebaldella sp. S0638]MCP1222777.1 phosphoribosylformylglycinamidine synthase [Sebaldella sp. S0638]
MNFRIFVEKKKEFNVEARELFEDLQENLSVKNLKNIRIVNIYDIFNIEKRELKNAKKIVFSEITVDNVYDEMELSEKKWFAVEYLPGQYDQRADSAIQCLNLISKKNRNAVVKSGKLLIFDGNVNSETIEKIKKYYINSIEMREKDLEILEENTETENKEDIEIYNGFINYKKDELEKFLKKMELAMTFEDLEFVQQYFKETEKRDPTETEIKVLDTYWSDHCRHTTFETRIKDIKFETGKYKKLFQETFDKYMESRRYLFEKKEAERPITLMDMATIFGKEQRKKGYLDDMEVSDEINACSVFVDVEINGKNEKWLMQFKNETHNHPTEIEPFGGASTCIGGAIRDPLSGRTYVYQAMRISGSADPRESIEDTLSGKLPQKVITRGAAHGFSSYGNQIGLTTTHVTEVYDEGYKAKRLETGLVIGAASIGNIRRDKPLKSDVIILLGGKTGRDGCGGATGSSKEHSHDSFEKCSAEVQKGNAITERKIQRLFRNETVTKLIKKCNDFGAGGVSVAIGELADGLEIDLDKVPVKYIGLDGTELAISESQERMAVVVARKDAEKFISLAKEENLEATIVARVTDKNRLVMTWKNKRIVDISRKFLNTNGALAETEVLVKTPDKKIPLAREAEGKTFREKFINNIKTLNTCSQKGLSEMFDSTIGASTVLMPYGGRYQLTPADVSVQKFPVQDGITNTASMAAHGYNQDISKWSPFHGALYAVIESVSKIAAAGGDYKKIRFTFQEYFERLGKDKEKWGKPFSALLGALYAQKEFELPSIGGKDSMSGTFNELNVPPTLISFAVNTVNAEHVISSEFKAAGNNIYLIKHSVDDTFIPDIQEIKENYNYVHKNILEGNIISAMALKQGGIGEAAAKMCFGNKIGAEINIKEDEFFKLNYGAMIVESETELNNKNAVLIGKTISSEKMRVNGETIELSELIENWESVLEMIFPSKLHMKTESIKEFAVKNNIYIEGTAAKVKFAKPRAGILVFPGNNCEYDTVRVLENNGAVANTVIFNNMSQSDIEDSINRIIHQITNSQILVLPGGFSSGDEPDGSAKFIAAVLRNKGIAKAIEKFLKRDGLILGICNGFQALIKSGLLPYGKITELEEDSSTLTYNSIGRHVSKIVPTKIVSNRSPWLSGMSVGDIHKIAMSHGEGRLIVDSATAEKLFKNGQVITQYVDLNGNPTMDSMYNPNNSDYAIEGLISENGRILGKMGHSERMGTNLYKNIKGNKEQNIFINGIKYFK